MPLVQDGQESDIMRSLCITCLLIVKTNKAFPGRKTKVTLSGSQVGVLYVIGNDTIRGTGYPLSFGESFPEGLYTPKGYKGACGEGDVRKCRNILLSFLKAGYCTEEVTRQGILPLLERLLPGVDSGRS